MTDSRCMRLVVAILAVILLSAACTGSDNASPELAVSAPASDETQLDDQARELESPDQEGTEGDGAAAGGSDASSEQGDVDENAPAAAVEDAPDEATSSVSDLDDNLEDEAQANLEELPAAAPASGDSEVAAAGSELDQLVTELMDFVERERGLAFVERPDVQVLDTFDFNDAWQELVLRAATTEATEFANFTDIYQAVGIIDDGRNLDEIWTRFGDAGVLGYYDTETEGIVLRSGELNAFTETVLVHELVHALEDQVFGLDRAEFENRDDEIDWTFSALIEGSARVIEGRYRASFSQAELSEESAARNAVPRSVSLNEFTPSFLELQFGRYDYGETFAEALWELGQSELDDAYAQPPATSEEVVNPQAFLAGVSDEGALAFPPADGDVFEQGTWGQAGIAALLTDVYPRDEALEISQGWGGDRFVAWRDGEITCVRIHVGADSPEALDRYATAFEEWAQLGDRQIFFPSADLVRITSCA